MQGVTSVRRDVEVEEPSKGCGCFLLAFGGLCVLAGFIALSEIGAGGLLLLLVAGGFIFWAIKEFQGLETVTTYIVTLTTASGQTRAIQSQDQAFIDQIIAALNNAIIARG